ncbi:orotidine-5'-phosphate decarboxylase [Pseudogracilibacillus auburnensis]|uniref:Orotidine 5'-phosphate decarboxylase n=1 Tax=Pseudogracilibacillus auburnensis TaxID=1494959 RepID=A0A2V3W8G1_9BACI|nr:orotidine-5'-phosphate decarboxylase [Pseudogracilibacillus auburnensis]PXW88545.1 orotidine-5'-phosphate decarboxylase [Pseudogracilibacillus auburnensis]
MNHIYLALDFPTWEESKQFLDDHQLKEVPVKVGMELFYREGAYVIEQLKNRNHPIFLDLKLHDIPTTVMRAMRNLATLEVDIVNVHALGGSEMIKRAKEGLASINKQHETKLIAVTILTSMDEQTMNNDLQLQGSIEQHVTHLAKVAKNGGADGVVCSVHEVEMIKQHCGTSFLTVTPGIRLPSSKENDQKRVATPSLARRIGTDSIVIGRSITKANNPLEAYQQAQEEWKNGTSK